MLQKQHLIEIEISINVTLDHKPVIRVIFLNWDLYII